jgi:ribosomal protein S27E
MGCLKCWSCGSIKTISCSSSSGDYITCYICGQVLSKTASDDWYRVGD